MHSIIRVQDPANTANYLANGNKMVPSVVGMGLREALSQLPAGERTDARSGSGEWPYE